jgi:hypothetical protein
MSELKYVVDHYCAGDPECLHCEILRLRERVSELEEEIAGLYEDAAGAEL